MSTITPADTYALSDDHVAFDTIRQIVRERVAPRAAEMETGTAAARELLYKACLVVARTLK